jgi:hypothetical protein
MGYGDCVNNDPMMACLPDEECLEEVLGMSAACSEQNCMFDGECTVPATGDAEPVCADVNLDGVTDCYLDCSGGETCPDGMICVQDFACLWEPMP